MHTNVRRFIKTAIGFLFDTVFTLSDLSVVYLLTQGGPGNATKILPVLAYQVGIQAGNLGRGAAIAGAATKAVEPSATARAPAFSVLMRDMGFSFVG